MSKAEVHFGNNPQALWGRQSPARLAVVGLLLVVAIAVVLALPLGPEVHAEAGDGTGKRAVIGIARVGETLSASTTGISDEEGLTSADYSYQWIRGDGGTKADIQDATASKLISVDMGKTSRVQETFDDDRGHRETLASAATARVAAVAADPDNCPEGRDGPVPVDVEVTAVPIIVDSTTDEYFVLYAGHDLDEDNTVDLPVSVTLGQTGTTTLSENIAALPAERYRVEKFLISNPADVDGDCIDDITELANPTSMNPVNPAGAIALSDGAVSIPDRETFEALSFEGLISDDFEYLSFILYGMDTDSPGVYFINTTPSIHHYDFVHAAGLDWDQVLRGQIAYAPEATASEGKLGVYSYRLYPFNFFHTLGTIERSYTVLAASMPLIDGDLAFHLTNEELPFSQDNLSAYGDSRISLVFDEDLFSDTNFLTLNPGEGFGLLRVREPDERPHPREIVIYESLPNSLPRVAGIVSTAPQTPLSHVNLRAVQDSVPNAFIRGALDNPHFVSLRGSYVHLAVTEDGYSIRAATAEEVESHYAASRPTQTQTPQRDLSVTSITPLKEIGFSDWRAFGVKAANVAVLRKLAFPYPAWTVPDGFAVPFFFYDEFMKHNSFYDDITQMLADPDFQSDFDKQEKELKKLRKKIKKGDMPEWIIEALTAMHATYPEGQSLRYRSSTNNEDLPGFNGAGLYDSKTQHPDETVEDGIDKSLKQVYASLWNFRAFTEREFHRIDHMSAAMGVLVHPNYSDELANGVAVSFDPVYGRDESYYVNTQLGEDLVTNPEAHSVPDEILLNPASFTVLATSNLVPPGELLLSSDRLIMLRANLKTIHEEFSRLYNPGPDEPFAIEIEFKITSDDVPSIKQARPWVFGETTLPPEDNPGTHHPFISGTPRVGETLVANTTGIPDASSLDIASFTYQWIRSNGDTETDIQGALSSSYTVIAADEGRTIKVKVTFNRNSGNEEQLTSAPTAQVAPRLNRPARGTPTITGTGPVGQTLTANTGRISDPDGLSDPTFKYQWVADDGDARTDIEGAKASTYTPTLGEIGKSIRVKVTFTDDYNNEETLTSRAAVTVTASVPEPPQHLRVSVHDAQRLDVFWEAPASDGGSPITEYKVEWKETDSAWEVPGHVREAKVTATAYTIGGLTDDTEYTVRVIAFNDVGEGAPSGEQKGRPRETTAPELSAAAVKGATLTLTYDEALDDASVPATTTFSVTAGDTWPTVEGVAISGRAVTLTLASTVASGDTVTVSYTIPSDEAVARIRDLAWNDAPSFRNQTAVNGTPEPTEEKGGSLLSATLTVGERNNQHGYTTFGVLGGLSTKTFSLDGTDYTVKVLAIYDDVVGIGLTQSLSSHFLMRLDGLEIASEDASIRDPGHVYIYQWPKGDLSWSEGDQVEVSLLLAVVEEQAENSRATGAPYISGTAWVDQTLTAHTSGIVDADGLTKVSYGYQWLSDDTEIEGATNSTYKVQDDDIGKTIKVRVTFTDDQNNAELLTSPATETVVATVPGTPRHLRVFPHDAQGLDVAWEAPASDGGSLVTGYTVQWKEVDDNWDTAADVTHETVSATTHIINGLADGVGYSVRLIASNSVGDSPPTSEVSGTPRETTPPHIVRSRVDGTTLRVLYDEALDEDSVPSASVFDVRVVRRGSGELWQDEKARRGVDSVSVSDDSVTLTLSSAVTSVDYVVISYTPPAEEASLRVRDTAGNAAAGFGFSEVFNDTEEAEKPGEDLPNSPPTGAPTINGTAQVGETLTADTSGIADEDGLDNATFSYQWIRTDSGTDTDVAGETAQTYTLRAADEGRAIKVRVTFRDDADNEESLTSAATGAVGARPNNPATGAPTISGAAQVGKTLTADTSSIADADGLTSVSYRYQWIRSDGGTGGDIAGANASTYELRDADQGKTIKVRVSFTDDRNNNETLTSRKTAAVAPRSPLTASFLNMPSSHDGQGTITFELRFSEEFSLSYRVLKEQNALSITNGTVTKTRRMEQGSNASWEIQIQPDGNGSVTIVLPVTTNCDDLGAICTGDGRKLSNRNELTVSGPGS